MGRRVVLHVGLDRIVSIIWQTRKLHTQHPKVNYRIILGLRNGIRWEVVGLLSQRRPGVGTGWEPEARGKLTQIARLLGWGVVGQM